MINKQTASLVQSVLILILFLFRANTFCYSQERISEINIDAADVVSEKYILKESEAIYMNGVTVYPRPQPLHPMAEYLELVQPGPPELPLIELETKHSNNKLAIPPRLDKITSEQQMQEALKKLRQEHEQFLRDFTPGKPESRVRVDLKEFSFRYETAEDERDINLALEGGGTWEKIYIPHYVGPAGKWGAFYRTELDIPEDFWKKDCFILHFNGVDYWSQVYLNGRCIGTHTGGWAPFELDVTKYLDPGRKNVLVVRVENDFRMRVYGGEKIYAATGPGFDKPDRMWFPSDPGAGLWQKCWLEARPNIHITDIFVIPDVLNKTAEVHVEVTNMTGGRGPSPIDLKLDIFGKNFECKPVTGIPVKAEPAGGLANEYVVILKLDEFREWTPEHPSN